MNSAGKLRNRVTAQEILGRPFRRHWAEAMERKQSDVLAKKDEERKKKIEAMRSQQQME